MYGKKKFRVGCPTKSPLYQHFCQTKGRFLHDRGLFLKNLPILRGLLSTTPSPPPPTLMILAILYVTLLIPLFEKSKQFNCMQWLFTISLSVSNLIVWFFPGNQPIISTQTASKGKVLIVLSIIYLEILSAVLQFALPTKYIEIQFTRISFLSWLPCLFPYYHNPISIRDLYFINKDLV